MENFERALSLMGIGMITVFVVLVLVVVAGNLLIKLVNTFAPAAETASSAAGPGTSAVSSKKVAAITSAVYHATGGKGKVEKIEKM